MIWQFAIYGFLLMLFAFIVGIFYVAVVINREDPDNEEYP